MSKKPKFLYRPNELGEWFASIGRKLKEMKKSGVEDWGLKDRHRVQREMQREQNTQLRHAKWHKVYREAYDIAYQQETETNEKTENQAHKYARQKAEKTVIDTFADEVSSPRTVRDVMAGIESDAE